MSQDNLNIEVCSQCHPFYTGKQKLVDTGGRDAVLALDVQAAFPGERAVGVEALGDADLPHLHALLAADAEPTSDRGLSLGAEAEEIQHD